jgi:hypothetical protein
VPQDFPLLIFYQTVLHGPRRRSRIFDPSSQCFGSGSAIFASWIRIKNADPDPAACKLVLGAKSQAFFKQILTKTDTERSMAQLDKYVGNRQYKV